MRCPLPTVIRHAAIAMTALLVLAGCGSGKSPIGPMMAARHPAPVKKALPQGPRPPTDMVAAMGDGKPGAARIGVRFDLGGKPQVGQPLDVNLAIMPSAGLDRVYGKVVADEGLELLSGAEIQPTERPAEDAVISHSLRVVPRREGVLTLRAVVSADSGGLASSQTFSIPLIAAEGGNEDARGAAPQASAGSAGAASPPAASDAPSHPPQRTAAANQ